jgi:hypothetical protein
MFSDRVSVGLAQMFLFEWKTRRGFGHNYVLLQLESVL